MPAVNPGILQWARETAGLSLEQAAHALQLNDSSTSTGSEKLAAYEAGEKEPGRTLLKRMSQKYRRPLLVFYLSEPPTKGDRGKDFRTLPIEVQMEYDADLDALIRSIRARQNIVRSLLEDEESEPLSFVGSANLQQDHKAVAQNIISILGFKLSDFRAKRTVGEAFAYLRECVENSGIFVLLIGDLGSHHSTIPVEVFRGFAVADHIAPFVVVNDKDARSAWSFTLLHEVTHLWLGTTGISNTSDKRDIERFCNSVAGSILLPSQELVELANLRNAPMDEVEAEVSRFAEDRNLSRTMVAYNLHKQGAIGQALWQQLVIIFEKDRIELEKRLKATERKGSGPNYYIVRRHRLGPALLGLTSRTLKSGILSPTKAGIILGIKPRNVQTLLGTSLSGGDM